MCTGCSSIKPLGEFSANRRNRTHGRQHKCKSCKRSQVVDWEQRHPGAKAKIASAYHYADPERHRQSLQRWRTNNPHKARTQYRKAAGKRRALEAKAFIEDVDPQIVYEMHGGMCGICKDFVAKDEFEVDHVMPIARGGKHGYINVQPAHRFCNRSKKDRVENGIIDALDK